LGQGGDLYSKGPIRVPDFWDLKKKERRTGGVDLHLPGKGPSVIQLKWKRTE